MDKQELRFCPICAKHGFPESPSMKDSPLCGDCDDVMGTAIIESQSYASLRDYDE
jgi:hypothetical protein